MFQAGRLTYIYAGVSIKALVVFTDPPIIFFYNCCFIKAKGGERS